VGVYLAKFALASCDQACIAFDRIADSTSMTEAPKAAPIVAKVKPVHWHKLPFGKYLMYELNRPGFRIIFFPFW
jgi:hypothetical protein